MHALCFRVTNALAVIGDRGMLDFYSAAEEGFSVKLDELSVEEAKITINQSQVDQYLALKAFTEEKEMEAAEDLKVKAQETVIDAEKDYKSWEEMLDDNQTAEAIMEKAIKEI
jgi:hypothetical protein